jgi:hypothetical protein
MSDIHKYALYDSMTKTRHVHLQLLPVAYDFVRAGRSCVIATHIHDCLGEES